MVAESRFRDYLFFRRRLSPPATFTAVLTAYWPYRSVFDRYVYDMFVWRRWFSKENMESIPQRY